MCIRQILVLVAAAQIGMPHAAARPTQQNAAFSYQGVLKQSNAPVTGSVDLQFGLFDAPVAGNQIGATLPVNAVSVVEGVFTSSLDFGSLAFNGQERWLEIAVRAPAGSANPFVTLTPRQKLASAPYAAYALNAALPATYANPVNFNNAGNAFNGVFTGSGFGLTSLNPLALSGLIDSGNIGGTYSNAVTFSNAGNSFTGSHSGDGSGLTGLNASNISSGTLNLARLPTSGSWSLSNLTLQRSLASNINPTLTLQQTGAGSASAIRYLNSAGNHFNLGMTSAGDFGLGYNANPGLAGDLLRMTPTGNLGVGTLTPVNRLDVEGGAAIGAAYAGTSAAPANGLIVEGDVGIGTTSPTEPLHIVDSLFSTVLLERTAGSQVSLSAQGSAGSVGTMNAFPFRLLSNNSVRMTVTPTGDVGVGTTGPLAKLHVNGDLRVDGSISISAATRYATISPIDFKPQFIGSETPLLGLLETGGVGDGAFVGIFPGDGACDWIAPVRLPDGAVPNELQVQANDDDSSVRLTVRLRRYPQAAGSVTTMATVLTPVGATAGVGPTAFTSAIGAHTIDNALNQYVIHATWPGGTGSFTIWSVRIRYTVTAPLP